VGLALAELGSLGRNERQPLKTLFLAFVVFPCAVLAESLPDGIALTITLEKAVGGSLDIKSNERATVVLTFSNRTDAPIRFRIHDYDLGCFYATGDRGFPKDQSSARNWYGLAARQGHADAQYNYAFMLLLGEGGLADREGAYVWFRKAADAGEEEARRFLAENPYEKAEPGAAPSDGPATQPGNSGVAEGPPSVS
jgi:hypothetical protein